MKVKVTFVPAVGGSKELEVDTWSTDDAGWVSFYRGNGTAAQYRVSAVLSIEVQE